MTISNPHTISGDRTAVGLHAALTIEAHQCDLDNYHGQVWEHHPEWSSRLWQCAHEHTDAQQAFDCASEHLEGLDLETGHRTACVLVEVAVPEAVPDADEYISRVVSDFVAEGHAHQEVVGVTVAVD